jgi:hypothetical protein
VLAHLSTPILTEAAAPFAGFEGTHHEPVRRVAIPDMWPVSKFHLCAPLSIESTGTGLLALAPVIAPIP